MIRHLRFALFINLLLILIVCTSVSTEFVDYTMQEKWGGMCNKGRRQSPIDFTDQIPYQKAEGKVHIVSIEYYPIEGITLDYMDKKKFGASFKKEQFGGMKVEVGNIKLKYDLIGLNFHVRAEHMTRGVHSDLEIQLVHKLDKEYIKCETHGDEHLKKEKFEVDENEYLIVSILFKSSHDDSNPDISKLHIGTSRRVEGFDLKKYITKEESFYFYKGSFTIPECEENVNWMIYEIPHVIGANQLEEFVDVFRMYGYIHGNNRNAQDLHNRDVFYHSKNIH